MTKLKKFTLICAIIFLVCALAVLVLLPLTMKESIKIYNNIVTEEIDFYEDTVLDSNIKVIKIANHYWRTAVKKSTDGKIHIETIDKGFEKMVPQISANGDEGIVTFDFVRNPIINRENMVRILQAEAKNLSWVTIYVPEDVEIITNENYPMLLNPYTNKFYSIYKYDDMDIIIDKDYSKQEEIIDENIITSFPERPDGESDPGSLMRISEAENELRAVINELERIRAEVETHEQYDEDAISMYDSAYEEVLSARLNLVNLICKYYDYSPKDVELLAYKLTTTEQSRDISKLKIKIANYKYKSDLYSRDLYTKIKNEETAKIDNYNQEIFSMAVDLDKFFSLNFNVLEEYSNLASSSSEETEIPQLPQTSEEMEKPVDETAGESSSSETNVVSSSQEPEKPVSAGESASSQSSDKNYLNFRF